MPRLLIALFGFVLTHSVVVSADNSEAGSNDQLGQQIFDAVESHFDRYTLYCMDSQGRTRSGMLASEFETRPLSCGKVSNLYRSLPMLRAALEMSRRTGCKCYTDSAKSHLSAMAHFGKSLTGRLPLDTRADYALANDRFAASDDFIRLGQTRSTGV